LVQARGRMAAPQLLVPTLMSLSFRRSSPTKRA
jgi:hypothetical protein